MATHSSVLAWRIPETGEPGGLPSMGSHRVGHNWSDLAVVQATVTRYHKWMDVNNRNVFLTVQVAGKSKVRTPDD